MQFKQVMDLVVENQDQITDILQKINGNIEKTVQEVTLQTSIYTIDVSTCKKYVLTLQADDVQLKFNNFSSGDKLTIIFNISSQLYKANIKINQSSFISFTSPFAKYLFEIYKMGSTIYYKYQKIYLA